MKCPYCNESLEGRYTIDDSGTPHSNPCCEPIRVIHLRMITEWCANQEAGKKLKASEPRCIHCNQEWYQHEEITTWKCRDAETYFEEPEGG